MQISVNDDVEFTPTDRGVEIWKAAGGRSVTAGTPKRAQLWEVMNVFGSHTFNGCVMPIECTLTLTPPATSAMRPIEPTLAADVVACLTALRKTSTDPVACALAQRLVAELSITHVEGE